MAALMTSLGTSAGPEWTLAPLGFSSLSMGGTDDMRFGWGLAVQRAVSDKRLTVLGWEGSLVLEGYVYTNHGGGRNRFNRDVSNGAGIALSARYPVGTIQGFRFFVEPGFGFLYIQRGTHDLPSRVNSTPMVGLSAVLPVPSDHIRVTLRLFHASNGGTLKTNPGQNQAWLMVGYRY